MTPEEARKWIIEELKRIKAVQVDEMAYARETRKRLEKIEGYADSRIKNKQGGGAHKMYDPNAPDPPRPPIDKPE